MELIQNITSHFGVGLGSVLTSNSEELFVEDDALREARPVQNFAIKSIITLPHLLIPTLRFLQEPLVTVASAIFLYIMASYYR